METQVTDPLVSLSVHLPKLVQIIKDKLQFEEDYIASLKDYTSYCASIKDLLKLRDQKQIDHEELCVFLQNCENERMRCGKGVGISGFIQDKINDFKGVDPEKIRNDRLLKLDAKIVEVIQPTFLFQLKAAVLQTEKVSDTFSEEVEAEYKLFDGYKTQDFKEYLKMYVDLQIEFHEKVDFLLI